MITELLKKDVIPDSLGSGKIEQLGQAWKQINAPFGALAVDVIEASTAALASSSPGDSVYADAETALEHLGSRRDALAAAIRLGLWNAEFNGQALNDKTAKDWIKQANALLADRRTGSGHSCKPSEADAKELGKINHIVVIYEENHSFDNLYGGWEGVNGLAERRSRAHAADEPGRHAVQLPAAERREPGDRRHSRRRASTRPGTPRGPFGSHFTNAAVPHRRVHLPPTGTTCPPNSLQGFAPERLAQGHRVAGRLHPRHRPSLLPRAVPARRREAEPLHDGQRRHGPDDGHYDTKSLPIYQYLHGRPSDYAIEDNFFQAAFGGSFLNHQWLISAASPVDAGGAPGGANAPRHPILDTNGMPSSEPLYIARSPRRRSPPDPRADRDLLAGLVAAGAAPRLACGN